MAYIPTTYTGNAATTQYVIGFGFVATDHVSVLLDDVDQSSGWQFTNSNTEIAFDSPPADGVAITITRTTPSVLVTDFISGAQMTVDNLDKSFNQSLYFVEEAAYGSVGAMAKNTGTAQWDATSVRVTNVSDPVSAQDAATKTYADANAVLTAADVTSTAASAAVATTKASEASLSSYTAGIYSTAAQGAASDAQIAETNAETAQANAETAETNAETAQAAAEAARDATADLVPTPSSGGSGEQLFANDAGTEYENRVPHRGQFNPSSDQSVTGTNSGGAETAITGLNNLALSGANGSRLYMCHVHIPHTRDGTHARIDYRVYKGTNGDITTDTEIYRFQGNTQDSDESFMFTVTPGSTDKISVSFECTRTETIAFNTYHGGLFYEER